jgi:dCTP deaminase
MLKSDISIKQMATRGMIRPFESSLVRKVEDLPVLSYGCSSYGYDLRLSPKEFLVFRHIPGTVVNCKAFNPANLEPVELHCDQYGEFFILPGHSYGLGVTVEHLDIPSNITCLFIGKSTLARTGVILNTTPGEAGWKGYLTLEFSNSSAADCRIYANEGICQALFIEGEPCDVTYRDRNGKYQGQPEAIVTARV